MKLTEKQLARFWSKIRLQGEDECWPWIRGKSGVGYGTISINGRTLSAHRIAFMLAYGELTTEKPYVLHACDNRACCNFKHLWAGTNEENIADRHAKKRDAIGDANGSRTHPEKVVSGDKHYSRLKPHLLARGENNGNVKLTPTQVREIRQLLAAGVSQRKIAACFGVSRNPIMDIHKNVTWRHIT